MSKNATRYQHDDATVVASDRGAAQPTTAEMEEFERFFREQFAPATDARAAAPASMNDPLMAQLASIVGQERGGGGAAPKMPAAHDPFSALSSASSGDPLKIFEEELRRFDEAHQVSAAPQPEVVAAPARPAPAMEDLNVAMYPDFPYSEPAPKAVSAPVSQAELRRADLESAIHHPEPQALGPVHGYDSLPGDEAAVPPPDLIPVAAEAGSRPKRVLVMLGAAAAIGLTGVIGTLGFSGSRPKTPTEAPVISAKSGPVKEKPADAGGVEITGQDRQVLSRKTEEPKGATSVVTKEEQPVDLNQTPKREAPRIIAPASGNAAAPQAPSAPILMPASPQGAVTNTATLEPKRVRSVRISSEGEAPQAAPAPPAAKAPSAPTLAGLPPPTVSTPAGAKAEVKADARPATAAPKPQAVATTTPQPARPARPAAAPAAAQTDDASPVNLRPQQTAKVTPPKTANTPVATAASGGFAVQMAAPGSEAEARTVISKIKADHSGALGSYSPGVRKADVNGRTVYRVRVGGLSREAANDLCTKLKADGGSCFVASN